MPKADDTQSGRLIGMSRKAFVGLVFILLFLQAAGNKTAPSTPTPSLPPSTSPVPSETPSLTPTSSTSPSTSPNLFYPMTNYSARITVRAYGRQVSPTDNQALLCGDQFSGYHTGDDLEAYANEINHDVAVYAIAEGTVRRVEAVNGYGGLIVVEHTINNEKFTGYYGHIDTTNTAVSVNDTVQPGQKITVLGDNCSSETSNERKHLHFSLRRGTTIDVRGYVTSLTDLAAWVNPKTLLDDTHASVPN